MQSPSAMQTLSRQASMADDVERLQVRVGQPLADPQTSVVLAVTDPMSPAFSYLSDTRIPFAIQEGESHLRLEIAHLTQQLAASRDGNNCNHEVLMQAEEAATLAKASATTLQQDLATAKSQRDVAWKVRTESGHPAFLHYKHETEVLVECNKDCLLCCVKFNLKCRSWTICRIRRMESRWMAGCHL